MAEASSSTGSRGALPVFATALVVRLSLVAWAHATASGLLGDETLYLARAEALLRLLADAWTGREFDGRDVAIFYQLGIWPPLHAIWMAIFVALPIDPVVAARLSVAVVGAASSALAFVAARLLGGDRAGVAAGLLHALSPLFLYYGISLWSESLYAAFALGLFIQLLLWMRGARGANVVGAASMLGAMGLTRAAVVPFLVVVPLFMVAVRRDRRGLAHAAAVFGLALAVLAPWNAFLSAREGKPTFFSSRTAVQIWAGNNPYEGRLLDYAATVASFRAGADRALRVAQLEAEHRGESAEATARRLALTHIAANPLRFVARSFERALVLSSHDSFLLRFLVAVTTPPIGFGGVIAIWLLSAAAFSAMLGLAALGALCGRVPLEERALVGLGVLAVVGAPMLTVSHTRLAFPALVLVLPLAGLGWADWRAGGATRRQRGVGLASALSLLALALLVLPVHLRVSAQTSSWYAEQLASLQARMPSEPVYVDYLEVRGRRGRTLELRGARPGIEFPLGSGEALERAVLRGPQARDRIRIHSRGSGGLPLTGSLQSEPRSAARALAAEPFDPVQRERWNEWVAVGQGIELRWRGGELPGS